ncbi:CCA tRNA nucleotidyltransferase, partial [Candidatus Poribacteria bacterium]|nr:CCA tRNA nucleotidyltransferase [Candidatus Poribacteria bacterium]
MSEQRNQLEAAAGRLTEELRRGGFAAYWVGGCVRDRLMGLEVKDVDIATDARPEEIALLWPDARLVGASFGVCVVPFEGNCFEVATFRRDGRYLDHRHPDSVEYGTLEQDARRRDF